MKKRDFLRKIKLFGNAQRAKSFATAPFFYSVHAPRKRLKCFV